MPSPLIPDYKLRDIKLQIQYNPDVLGYEYSTVNVSGAAAVPRVIARHLGLVPGEKLYFFVQTDNTVLIMPEYIVNERLEEDEFNYMHRLMYHNYDQAIADYYGEEALLDDSED